MKTDSKIPEENPGRRRMALLRVFMTTEGAGRRACPHERLWDRFFVVLRINPRLSAIYKE